MVGLGWVNSLARPLQVRSWAEDFGRRPGVLGPYSWRVLREAGLTEQRAPPAPVGGRITGRYLSDVQVFDLRNLAWSTLKLNMEPKADKTTDGSSLEVLPASSGHRMIKWKNKLLLLGGHSKDNFDSLKVRFIDLESYHCGVMETSGKVPVARGGQSVTLVGSKIIMFGGEDSQRRLLNDVHVLDLETMIWCALETVQTPPVPRFDHIAAVHAERYLLIFGGCSHSIFFNDLHVLDLQTMDWTQMLV
ncbi:acyl-CoA-binding domain-containing protein 5-like [Cornus florida]|uniref:acyl-CoA-binding domain-containing protein 5-like n=1 Tax=Cornus florida TaxID=4283 RepID=UPI0028A1D5FB|nr:acyl-CoA-binding domain-containing protein 5-like [Cornus florida]